MKKVFLVFLFLIIVISFACCFKLSKKVLNKYNVIEKLDKPIEKVENNTPKEESVIKDTSMPINTNHYKKSETITLKEYLHADKENGILKLNKNGDVIYNNKVIITKRNTPINNKTAYTDDEIIILFYAKGLKPEPGCDPSDTVKNGTLGCYIDMPEED